MFRTFSGLRTRIKKIPSWKLLYGKFKCADFRKPGKIAQLDKAVNFAYLCNWDGNWGKALWLISVVRLLP